MRLIAICVAIALVAYLAAVVVANRTAVPSSRPLAIDPAPNLPDAGRRLRLLAWNVGYAGLGAESDFIADGGHRILAPSRSAVDKNVAGLERVLKAQSADVVLLQEIAVTSPLNYWRPVWQRLKQARSPSSSVMLPDVVSRLLPWPLRLEHGLATLAHVRIADASAHALPIEPNLWFGVLRKQYGLLVTRFAVPGDKRQWVVVNVHLAAFDDAGSTRREQLEKLLEFARREYEAGNWVVVGGDWNMVLGGETFPNTTEERFLGWVRPLPANVVEQPWRIVFDPDVATVRTLYKPYVAGENFITIIDGFLVSPNVSVESIRTQDLGFAFSDHQPVAATFHAR